MDKHMQKFQETLNKSSRYFVFPTEKPHHDNVDDVVDKVKAVVSSFTTQSATETETTEQIIVNWPTQETTTSSWMNTENATQSETVLEVLHNANETITEVMNNANNTITEVMNNANGTIIDVMNAANATVTEVMNNANGTEVMRNVNGTIADVMNNANGTEVMNNLNGTIGEVMKNANGTIAEAMNNSMNTFIEGINQTSTTEKHKLFDWMDDEGVHNLTMVHAGLPEMRPDGDQTVFIILGVVLGVLFATSFVLLLVYISFKRSNLYTLQERAESSQHRPIPLQVSSTDERTDSELANDSAHSGYKF